MGAGKTNPNLLWGAFEDRAGEEISRRSGTQHPPEIGANNRRTELSILRSLFGGPNSLFWRLISLFRLENSLS